jgi:putative redox protein
MGVKISGTLTGTAMELRHEDSGAVIKTVPPLDNGGDGSSFSPTDLAATSLGSCASTTMALYAERNGIPLERISFDLEKIMNKEPRRLGKLVVRYRIASTCSDEDFARLERIGRTCPVRLSLAPDVEVDETYERG